MIFFEAVAPALTLCLLITPLMIKIAFRYNILDIPQGSLKTHKEPTPYLGGVALGVSILVTHHYLHGFSTWSALFSLGALLLTAVGLADDIQTFSPGTKFKLQALGCIALWAAGLTYHSLPLYDSNFLTLISRLSGLLLLLTMVNAVNLVDIMDGLASTTALIASVGLYLMSQHFGMPHMSSLSLILIGSLTGFLWYNKKPAQIYLGDAGALMLGGILGFIALTLGIEKTLSPKLIIPPLILGIFLAELLFLIIIRSWLSIPFYNGSPHHFALYLKRKGWSWHQIIGFVIVIGTLINAAVMTGLICARPHQLIAYLPLGLFLTVGLIVWTIIIYR